MKRESGYYFINHDNKWRIAIWSEGLSRWRIEGKSVEESDIKYINEHRILMPDESSEGSIIAPEVCSAIYYDLMDCYISLQNEVSKIKADHKLIEFDARQYRTLFYHDKPEIARRNQLIATMEKLARNNGIRFDLTIQQLNNLKIADA